MKVKIVLFIVLLSISLVGCSVKENILVEEGRNYLERHEYSKAKQALSDALEENSSDEHARAMYMQALRMENIEAYKLKNNYKKVLEQLKAIEKIKGGSSVIKSEASDMTREYEKLYAKEQDDQAQRKENAKIISNKDKYSVENAALATNKVEEKKEEESEENKVENSTPEKEENNTPIVIPKPDDSIKVPENNEED